MISVARAADSPPEQAESARARNCSVIDGNRAVRPAGGVPRSVISYTARRIIRVLPQSAELDVL
jgi:hypothetical protein